jgi:hypothetical protein
MEEVSVAFVGGLENEFVGMENIVFDPENGRF